ncbi:MAG: hypothetical protein UV68_C0020G0001, partial [Candidatus Collierbacteria bacterium GW2011_GWC2_43_12]
LKFLGLTLTSEAEATLAQAVQAENEATIAAAEELIPSFPQIRDEQAKAGVTEFKDGRNMVRTGTRKMEDGAEKVQNARKLGSRVREPKA